MSPRTVDPAARPAWRVRLSRSAPAAAAWSGFGAAAAGCFLAVVAALVLWIPDPAATGSSGSTMRAGVITFLAAQRGGVRLNGTSIGFVPLGLTMLAGWLCWRSGRAAAHLDVIGPDAPAAVLRRVVAIQVGAYAATCAALSRIGVVGTSSAPTLGVTVGALVVAGFGFGAAALQFTAAGGNGWRTLPATGRAAVRGAAGAMAVVLTGGSLLAMAATMRQAGRFLELSRGFGDGVVGLPIGLLGVLAAPNAVVAAAAYLVGPGFSVGAGSSYAPLGGHGGAVPAFPLLAGLPGPAGAMTNVLILMVVTVLAAGAVSGRLVRRSTAGTGWGALLAGCLGAAILSGVAMGALAGAAGGSLGSARLRTVGASPVQVALTTALELAVVGTLAAVADQLLRRTSSTTASPATDLSLVQSTIATRSQPYQRATTDAQPAADDSTADDSTADDSTADDSTAGNSATGDVRAGGQPDTARVDPAVDDPFGPVTVIDRRAAS